MSQTAAIQAINAMSVHVCESLFADYGLQITHAPEEPGPTDTMLYCGILGFSGDTLRGAAVLAASQATLETSNPILKGATRDWIAELVNQFLGRLKLRLLARQIEISLAVPVVLRGEQLSMESKGPIAPLWFKVGGSTSLGLWLDLEFCEGFVIGEETQVMPDEGSMMML